MGTARNNDLLVSPLLMKHADQAHVWLHRNLKKGVHLVRGVSDAQ
jgi:hypothetical protein